MNTDTVTPCQDDEARWFFDRAVDNPRDSMAIAVAKRYCEDCPLKNPCMAFALEHGGVGVYGGVMFTTPVKLWLCRKGHDLTGDAATRKRGDGVTLCRACEKDAAKRRVVA